MKWYTYDIRNLTYEEYHKWYSLMSNEKKRRVDRFRFNDDKKRTVVGEMLARKAIAEWYSVKPESIVFAAKEHGKPYVVNFNVEFNISHSDNMVVCAVDDKPVGIDIEEIRPIDLNIAKRICIDEELLCIFGHIPTDSDFTYTEDTDILTRFFELWTKKEACGKLSGIGLYDYSFSTTVNLRKILFSNLYIITIAFY